MKKFIYYLFVVLFVFTSCSKEDIIDALKHKPKSKVNVCHYDADADTWKTININGNALEAHLNHGDVSLVDADGDG